MKIKNISLKTVINHYKEITLLNEIKALLDWDLNVNLPVKASESRAEQSAQITKLISNYWLNPEFRKPLEKIIECKDSLTFHEQAMVRNLENASHYYYKVPQELIIEFSKTASESFMAWQQAKKEDDVKLFLPYLNKIVFLNQKIAQHLGYKDNRYDALLNQYEQSLTTKQCKELFQKLRIELVKLLKSIQKSTRYREENDLVSDKHHYSLFRQKQLSEFILHKIGYDTYAGHLAISAHPFTQVMHRSDVRITTWYDKHDPRPSLMATIHEAGHAMYEQGVADEYDYTPLSGGISLGIHESQSRFWENQIGRSPEFLSYLTPILQAFFPDQLSKTREDDIIQLFNHVKPSMIRVEADEVTYNLHIALRFELEEALINNKITTKDLPELWRSKMKDYLGVVPKTDQEGMLQDVHWSYGAIGYFPTYTLGNLYAAQFTHAMKKELDISSLISSGKFGTILSWLRENIHQYGSLYWPDELVEKVSGGKLDSHYYIDYLKKKYQTIYSIK